MSALSDPTPVEEGMVPTPAQLLYRWENETDERRLERCRVYLVMAEEVNRCYREDHASAVDWMKNHRYDEIQAAEKRGWDKAMAALLDMIDEK